LAATLFINTRATHCAAARRLLRLVSRAPLGCHAPLQTPIRRESNTTRAGENSSAPTRESKPELSTGKSSTSTSAATEFDHLFDNMTEECEGMGFQIIGAPRPHKVPKK
jgi:hypothetical protein